ncbi:FkbM family methyltransferase [Altererythrobacter sp.]|uniref:FkbM family methyltransferase n=1 Tax=Altererythrobacter sp. TaxID=1872480 RepID=UPI001B16BB93|nr:FkbM family methyltransferase [Altererythrobacter sp.]MBO6609852.1 FkbM family methyltransferase [Altererythrobacter sp.]MBO6642208.1 FkbM family methyltransferase [Altererythrobacter sp.]MBO6709284.1 FkbM family methyltransferase [Altererythrobacter sp.]
MNLGKAIRAALVPAYWKGLVRAVVPTTDHAKAFAELEFATVIDVGGNVGQFSLFASHRWPTALIHAFEPIPDQSDRFAAVHGNRVTLHRCALGEKEAKLPIHIASRKDSSSLLPLGNRQKTMFEMDEIGTIEVSVKRLDEVLDANQLPQPALLKIDVQGFEYEVLRGATRLLDHFSHIYVEVSFIELYEGQKLDSEITAMLNALGFMLSGQFNITRDPGGNLVQADLLFKNQERAEP